MMDFQPISIHDLKDYISFSFDGDSSLFSKYHKIEGTHEECVDHTYKTILDTNQSMNLEAFAVIVDGNTIGYTIMVKHIFNGVNVLYSFGINKNYRTFSVVKEWLSKVSDLLEDKFICVLWSKNTRAINFLLRNGMTLMETTIDTVTLSKN